MVHDRCNCYFSFWTILFPFTPPPPPPPPPPQQKQPKKWKFQKNEKTPGYIFILHKCTTNHDHMLYCSWDMACDGCNYFSFWTILCPLPPYVCYFITLCLFPIYVWVKFCIGCFRQVFFIWETKKWSLAMLDRWLF